MHLYTTPSEIEARVLKRLGRRYANETVAASRSALVVIDMQNYYVAEGFPSAVASARAIVPRINEMAAAMRAVGGHVIWIQTTATGALDHWAGHHRNMLSPESVARRLAGLDEAGEGFGLYAGLDTHASDLRVKKIKYDAMLADSSDFATHLAPLGIDTLLIAGTKTNVCCESTARDAAMRNYKVVMLADCNATSTDAEHAATLNTFQLYFGDVMNAADAIARLRG